MSQTELADKIGLNRGNIASYENGTAEPKASNLLKIVKLFNIKLEYLLQSDLEKLSEADRTDISKVKFENKDDIDYLRKKSGEILEIIRGKILFHNHRLERMDDVSEDILKSGQELIDVGNLASELAQANIRLCNKLSRNSREK